MKKLILIPILCLMSGFAILNNSPSLINDSSQSCFVDASLNLSSINAEANSVISLLLYDEIDKAIQNYYSKPTQFALYDSKVTNISQVNDEFSYKITIEVPTFNGPHNPPYGLEILTFIISPGVIILENYEHISLTN